MRQYHGGAGKPLGVKQWKERGTMNDRIARLIGGLLPLSLVMGCWLLASCKDDGQTGQARSGRPAELQRQIVVGFAQLGSESDWRAANTVSIKTEAEKRGIDLRFSSAQQRQENQIKALRSFIAQKVDVIAFSPVVETGWEPVLREIKQAGIPVILSDRGVDVSDSTLYVTFIAPDTVEEGRRAARWLVEHTTGDVKVFELRGTPGASCATDRKNGFEEVVKANPRMTIVKSQDGNFERGRGKEVMEAFLKTKEGKEFNALYAHNDDMALGAIQAMKEAGLKPGTDVKIVSIDAVKAAFEAMVAGELNCTVECSPLLGPQLFDVIEAVAAARRLRGAVGAADFIRPEARKPLLDNLDNMFVKRIMVKEGVFDQSVAKDLIGGRKY
jgi:simple sugar transport system substrate-binding protein